MPEPDREAVGHGGRRVGDLVPGGGEPAAHRGLQEKEPLHTQDVARPGKEYTRKDSVRTIREVETRHQLLS